MRCTPHLLPDTTQSSRFALCQLWALSNTALLQICRFSLKYSIELIWVSIPDIATIRRALYYTFVAKYRAPAPVCIMSTRVDVKSNVIAVLHIQDSIFHWTFLHCYWWYLDSSGRDMLHICCQIAHVNRFAQCQLCPVKYSVIAVLQILS